MAYTPDYDDIDYGDETRGEALQTVALPHDSSSASDLPEGTAVTWDSNNDVITAATDGDDVLGILYTYQYYAGNSGGSQIRTDRKATVAVGGKVKARVHTDVVPGAVAVGANGSNGELETTAASPESNFTALSGSQSQDDRFGNTAQYAEVLIH
jgi:hypothetical protein